jgi:4-amino-4-deoxy-L-arabinose transferase-like glycosyltransferase
MSTLSVRHGLTLLAILAVVIGFYDNLGGLPLFDVDEGAFSAATHEMLMRHDWITPTLYGVPRYDKPILIYWLQALSVSLLGLNEAALRLPSAVAATLWALAVFLFVRRVGSGREAVLAVAIMATSLLVPVIGKAAIADALLNLFLTCTMACVYLYYREGRRRFVRLAFAFMGLGFLTKGPVAVVIPLVVSGLFFALRRDGRRWLRAAFDPAGLALFVAIALPWYALEIAARGEEFIAGFFGHHNIGRFTGTMEGHGGGLLYYVPVVLLALVPYTAVFLKQWRRAKEWTRRDLELYLMLWFGFVFVFFSLSSTKLPHYILYGLTAVFILLALHFDELRHRWLAFLPALLFFAAAALLPEIVTLVLPHIRDRFVVAMLRDHDQYFSLVYQGYFAAAAAVTVYFALERRLSQTVKLVVCGLMVSLGVSQFILPAVAAIQQQPVKEAALIARSLGDDVVMWGLDRPSFGVYSGHAVTRRDPAPGDVVVTKTTKLGEFRDYDLLYSRNGIALLKLKRTAAPSVH